MTTFADKPWEHLEALIEAGRVKDLLDFFESLSPQETALVLSRLDEGDRTTLLTLLVLPVAYRAFAATGTADSVS